MVTRSRPRQGPLVALNHHLIWHGVDADVGIGIVSSRGSMPTSQPVTQPISQLRGSARNGGVSMAGGRNGDDRGEVDWKERVTESWRGMA